MPCNKLSYQFLILAMGCTFSIGIIASSFHYIQRSIIAKLSLGLLALIVAISAILFTHLAMIPISKLHTLKSALVHYIFNFFLYNFGKFLWKKSEYKVGNAGKVQNEILKRFISDNKETAFGKDHNFHEISNYDDFIERVPLVSYNYYQPYINRISRGESDILTMDKVVRLNVSSGTTGDCKMIPCTNSAIKLFLRFASSFRSSFIFQ